MAKKKASKANGHTELTLEILNPEHFQTIQEIRDFVTGEGARALSYAIGQTLDLTPCLDGYLNTPSPEDPPPPRDAMDRARIAASWVNCDLLTLAKAAVELEVDPTVKAFDSGFDDRLSALLFVTMWEGSQFEWLKLQLYKHLGAADWTDHREEPARD